MTIAGDRIHIENEVAFRVVYPSWFFLFFVGYQFNKERMITVYIRAIFNLNFFCFLSLNGKKVDTLRPIIIIL